jgi:phage terminase small subunit
MRHSLLIQKFTHAYIANDFKGMEAAKECGQSDASASNFAFRMLSNPAVVAAIAERTEELAARAGLTVEWVLNQWKQIAEADPNELISVCVECCRHCHGIGHEFQWTEFEYAQAVRAAGGHRCNSKCDPGCMKGIPPPNNGGFGFDPHIPPHEHCPVCRGDGTEKVLLHDTRRVKGAARRLYAGVKQTQHGIEVKMRDQDAALMNIAKFLRMVVEGREVTGPNGGPIAVTPVDARELTDDQLAALAVRAERALAELPASV